MQCTKEKYLIYFYNQTCESLIDFEQDQKKTHIIKKKIQSHMKHRRILWGKPQLKPHYLYYHTSGNISGLHKDLALNLSSSQYNPSLLLIGRINNTYAFSSVLQASYFLALFLLGDRTVTYVFLTSHTALTSVETVQSSNNEFLLHARDIHMGIF